MHRFSKHLAACALGFTLSASTLLAQAPRGDSSTIAPDGTATITRIVPVPMTVSPEAAKFLSRPASDAARPRPSIEIIRAGAAAFTGPETERAKKLYPVNTSSSTMGGVPVSIFTPLTIAPAKRNRVLLNIHGGGFHDDFSSTLESIPVANLTGTKVVSVLYRMAPEAQFPQSIDDIIAVYKELLKTTKPNHIAIFGSSAGAMLTGEVTAKIKQLHLPMPAATGIFSGWGDFSTQGGDSAAMYTLSGLAGHLDPPSPGRDSSNLREWTGTTDLKDPILSPLYSDLSGFPPTLFITSTRDALLSGTTILHRAYLRAGVDAQLVVFEALPHTFWEHVDLPESKEAYQIMAKFFNEKLAK